MCARASLKRRARRDSCAFATLGLAAALACVRFEIKRANVYDDSVWLRASFFFCRGKCTGSRGFYEMVEVRAVFFGGFLIFVIKKLLMPFGRFDV